MIRAQSATATRRTGPAQVFYAWLASMRVDIPTIRIAVAESNGRYQPYDPREVHPHAAPSGSSRSGGRDIGNLAFDEFGDDLDGGEEDIDHRERW